MNKRQSPYEMTDRQLASRVKYNLGKAMERLRDQADVNPEYRERFEDACNKVIEVIGEMTPYYEEPAE